MVTVDPISLAARRKEIADQIERLKQEGDELDIALRVLERYGNASSKPTEYRASIAEVEAIEADAADGLPRPSGAPTNFEMAEFVLSTAEKDGRDGLTASEIVAEIRGRYWPGLLGKQILPSIYQFAKNGRLRKTAGGKFKRVKKPSKENEAPAGKPEGASDTEA